MKNSVAVNVSVSIQNLTVEENRELREYRNSLFPLVLAKHPHSDWCELVTGLWHECDCGASDERQRAMDKIAYTWLKRRGKYRELEGNL